MAPSRGRGRGRRLAPEEEVPDVYRDMLKDVVDTSAKQPEEVSDSERSRPAKRRKSVGDSNNEAEPPSGGEKGKGVLIEDTEDDVIENDNNENYMDSEEEPEESSDESEADWEEVDLSKQRPSLIIIPSLHLLTASLAIINFTESPKDNQPLLLVLNQKEKQKAGLVRRTITAVDRRIRLEVHKMNILCLLIHVYQRSRWCNNSTVKVICFL